MDFNLPEELQILKETVRKFVDRRADSAGAGVPAGRRRYAGAVYQAAPGEGQGDRSVAARRAAEYGGAGLDLMSRCVIMEEVARTVAIPFRYAPIFGPEVRPVLFHCNEEQKKRFLLPVIRGEKRICFAQTEPDAGSDPAGMKTPRRQGRRSLHYQRHQTVYYRRQDRGLRASDRGNRSAEGRARRRQLFHGRHESSGRDAGKAVADDDGRHAGADSFSRMSECRPPI